MSRPAPAPNRGSAPGRCRAAWLVAGALAALSPVAARADLGPPDRGPSPCEGKSEGQACKLSDGDGAPTGTCIRRSAGVRQYLACTPPLQPSAYPPVPNPWATSTYTAAPAPAPSSTTSAPAPSGGCAASGAGANVGGAAALGVALALLVVRARRARSS